MSNINTTHRITETGFHDGTTLYINDHVYLAPDLVGEPYTIGRVMEFCTSHTRKGLHVRIARFIRMKDISNSKTTDSNLLMATMHSFVYPVSFVCGKCTVMHKHYVSNTDEYRKQPDHFYYSQLNDRYSQRVYDVVPCETVQNVHIDILEALKSRYQFIAVEEGKAAELTMVRTTCCVCQQWCSSALSVKCVACHKSFHMSCLNPPLAQKFPKGFVWQCAGCTGQDQLAPENSIDSVSSRTRSSSKPSTTTTTNKEKGPQKQPIKMTNMWPFRCFDENTTVADILDVNDSIYPRAKSRIGTKYEADLPDIISSSRPSRQTFSDRDDVVPSSPPRSSGPTSSMRPARGTDASVTIISQPGNLSESKIDEYMDSVKQLKNIPLPRHSSDLMDRALQELAANNYNTDIAYESMSKMTGDDFKHIVQWSPQEVNAFEQSIREHGHDFNHVKAAVKTKAMADIVRYFYQWKKTDRYEPVYSEWTKLHQPRKEFKRFPRDLEREAEEEARLEKDGKAAAEQGESPDFTIIMPKQSTTYHQCMNCYTKQSQIWRRSPFDFNRKGKIVDKVLCNDCGVYWLKYAMTKPISSAIRTANKASSSASNDITSNRLPLAEDTHTDKSNEHSDSREEQSKQDKEEHLEFDPSPCTICNLMSGPENSLYTCYSCGMSVHHDCYGVANKAEHIGWRCDPCQNKEKPVHVSCAVFMPEARFVSSSTLSPVEYIGCVSPARAYAQCTLCYEERGACVACPQCSETMHVQCAVENDYRLLFEILPDPAEKHGFPLDFPTIPAGLFGPNSAAGVMIPQVVCPIHSIRGKQVVQIDQRTADEARESALHVFCNRFKRVSSNSTPAMRRNLAFSAYIYPRRSARKIPSALDALVNSLVMDASLSSSAGSNPSRPNPPRPNPPRSRPTLTSFLSSSSSRTCSRCPAKVSPIWYSVGTAPSSIERVCYRCNSKEQQLNQQHEE